MLVAVSPHLVARKIGILLSMIIAWGTVSSLFWLIMPPSFLARFESLLGVGGFFLVFGTWYFWPQDPWVGRLRKEIIRILQLLETHREISREIKFETWSEKDDKQRRKILGKKYSEIEQFQKVSEERNQRLKHSPRSFDQQELLHDNIDVEKRARRARDALS